VHGYSLADGAARSGFGPGTLNNNALRERSRIDYFTALASQLSLPPVRERRADITDVL
jgi:hypothetical protein